MSLLTLLVVACLAVVILWAANSYLPAPLKTIVTVVVIVVLILCLLAVAHVLPNLGTLR